MIINMYSNKPEKIKEPLSKINIQNPYMILYIE